MSDALKVINNVRTLRAQSRKLPLETLEEILAKLTVVVEERRQEEAALHKQWEEKQSKLEAFRQQLLKDGIDPAELFPAVAAVSSNKAGINRAPRPAQYQYTDANGINKEWTGQGRMPKVIATAIKAGKKLEDFKIK